MSDKKFEQYGKSSKGNFTVIDTIAINHPYCITSLHLKHADSMILNAESIKHAETKGAHCGIKGCNLSYTDHKYALLVNCKAYFRVEQEELKSWLLSIKDKCEREGYEGFAFKRDY